MRELWLERAWCANCGEMHPLSTLEEQSKEPHDEDVDACHHRPAVLLAGICPICKQPSLVMRFCSFCTEPRPGWYYKDTRVSPSPVIPLVALHPK